VADGVLYPDLDAASPDPGKDPGTVFDPGHADLSQSCFVGPDWVCQDGETRQKCEGDKLVTETCADTTVCVQGACVPKVCKPFASECTGANTYRQCDSLGIEWSESQTCQAAGDIGTYCDAPTGKCLCELPVHVLFVLDASGSMQLEKTASGITQWEAALLAIAKVMDQYPFLTYGLATFPNQTVECGPSLCKGGGGCGYVAGVNLDLAKGQVQAIKDYLNTRILSKDPANLKYVLTPLFGIFDYLANVYPATGPLKTHPFPAYIVLLSDGQDSCYNPVDASQTLGPLADRTKVLRDQFGTKTFTIGFNLANGQDQLDAIAMHGGTGMAEFLPANDLTSLMAVFDQIFGSMEIRNCQALGDPPLAPDCPDGDQDGWCASLDCDDADPGVRPGAAEVAGNGKDDDCDGKTDEPSNDQLDQDGDGYTPAQGDCRDFDPLVGPGSFEVPQDGVDNDCDGKTDETACDCTAMTGKTFDAMACASELGCDKAFYKSGSAASPTGDDISLSWIAVPRFGSASNGLAPRRGSSYALVASGPATGTSHSLDLDGGGSSTDPYSQSDDIYDVIEYKVVLQAPKNALGFSIDYVFFSEEYDDYVGTQFNDKFYLLMNAPKTTSGQTKVINYTDCRDPSQYHDLAKPACPLASGYCCYIAINTALSECCWYDGCPKGKWKTDLSGTGYSCASSSFMDSDDYGSSTGWLTTSSPIEPGETFTLTFHVHDTGDGVFDSEVILDNFRWRETPTQPGTEPANP
jgi:hypothetical protein